MNQWRKLAVGLLVGASIGSSTLPASAQRYPFFQGGAEHWGSHDSDKRVYSPGRAALRWWDPLFSLSTTIDNWETTGVTALPGASWTAPGLVKAFNFFDSSPVATPGDAYVIATPVPSLSFAQPWLPASGTAPTFSWTFTGLTAGEDYAVSVNIPVGPSGNDINDPAAQVFQCEQSVYRIEGVVNTDNPGQPIYEIVNPLLNNGWVQLGANLTDPNRLFKVAPASTQIRVTLIATIPRSSDGQLVDTRTNIAVYADAARISRPTGQQGQTVAQPVVSQNAAGPFPWRTIGTRNEPIAAQDGSVIKSYAQGIVTSFAFDGATVDAANPDGRRNMVWSWPVQRQFDFSDTETTRYTTDRLDWIFGTGSFAADPKRTDQFIYVDNLNASVGIGAGWVAQNTPAGFKGYDYLQKVGLFPSGAVYAPYLPEGDYFIEVWVPSVGGLSSGVQIEIRQNGVPVSTVSANMRDNGGRWVRLSNSFTNKWTSTALAPLSISFTGAASPADGAVVADQVRFIRTADLSIRSTPVYTRAMVDDGSGPAMRDVVIVALENGKIYCLDAMGTLDGGGNPTGTTRVYWTYPSDNAADPNQADGIDGVDGVAEMPVGFNTSSAVFANVPIPSSPGNTKPMLFIGSQNGRVYAIDVTGRGDGTTTRLWTYPNDYPSPSVQTALGPIEGSLAYTETAAGNYVLVPTSQGRLYCLDAYGDQVQRITTVPMAYPSLTNVEVGSMTMAPVIGYSGATTDKVAYIGTNQNGFAAQPTLYALRVLDGNADGEMDVLWSRTNGNTGVFGNFRNASPVFIESADLNPNASGPAMPNTLVAGSDSFEIAAFDADNGNVLWSTSEFGGSLAGSLGFTYQSGFTNGGALLAPPGEPMISVPLLDGRYTLIYANSGRVNVNGDRLAWEAQTAGGSPTPMSFGGDNAPSFNYAYGADAAGYLYAFSYDPSLPTNGQAITPGQAPIPNPSEPNNPRNQIIRDIARNGLASLVLPADFLDLQQKIAAGTITYADVTAAANKVTRNTFEYGEALYWVVYDIPYFDEFAPPFQYNVSHTFDTPGASSSLQSFSVNRLTGAPAGKGGVALIRYALLPVGQSALTPGAGTVTIAIRPFDNPSANATLPNANMTPGRGIRIANPLAVSLVDLLNPPAAQHVGKTLVPSDSDNLVNGTPATKNIVQPFRPDLNSAADFVAHGQTANARMFVYDRSLMTLLFGQQRGISSIRMQLSNMSFRGSKLYALDPAIYPGLEDDPGTPGNNVSLDYPDIRRDRMSVVKSEFGAVENPLFQPVTLTAPDITSPNLTTYNSDPVQYNQFLNRELVATTFDFECNVPRFQPPATNGYLGKQFVYIDSGAVGRQISQGTPIEAFRSFDLSTAIAVDQRPLVSTTTVDLGSVPGGTGFLPDAPWNAPFLDFKDARIHNATRYPFFQRFSVQNSGNVNLLNMRIAKSVFNTDTNSNQPVTLFTNDQHPLAYLDGRLHVHTDIDPGQAAFIYAGRPIMGSNVIIQKPRPDDGEPTRLRMNPRVRTNANLGVTDGNMMAPGDFASSDLYDESLLDPKIAVSAPIGTPVGNYLRKLYAFEDEVNTATAYPVLERLATLAYEPYSEASLELRFRVRETRLTTGRTIKTSPMVDTMPVDPAGRFTWSNQQPAGARLSDGTLVVAFSSDRLLAGNPDINAGVKTEADNFRTPQFRIYFATLRGGSALPVSSVSPIADLDQFNPAVNAGNAATDRWFAWPAGAFPTTATTIPTLFGIPAGEVVANSAQFGNPVFPASGYFNPLSAFTNNGKTANPFMYMAFTGEVGRLIDGQRRSVESRLFLTQLTSSNGGGLSSTTPVPLQIGTDLIGSSAKIGKPTVVQVGDSAAVYFPMTTGGTSQIFYGYFDNGAWQNLSFGRQQGQGLVGRLNTGDAFESVSSPSALLRNNYGPNVVGQGGQARFVIDLVFTGRLRGRNQAEVYMARIPANAAGRPQGSDGSLWTTGPTGAPRFERLTYEPSSGLYWANGAVWSQSFDQTNGIDIQRAVVVAGNVTYESILVPGTLKQAEGSSIGSYQTTLGGRVYIDTASGNVRFSGAVIPSSTVLYVRYAPRFLRVSQATDMNHRDATILFDDRATGDNTYWFDQNGAPITSGYELSNRILVSYAKTASKDSQVTRPFLKTYRFGVQLPYSIATTPDGDLTGPITITFADGSRVAYQLDPANGRIYFGPTQEGKQVTITYRALDKDGNPLGVISRTVTVQMVVETSERTIPIEQVANESSVVFALDMLGSNSINVLDRPGMLWTFWTSTRDGGTDVFFETIAPRFTPVLPQ